MDKIFNLKIDTKNKNITTVTGLKQFDNNSILNITLLQNSLALDLSNCTVRINFLREDERVLLYMADIVSPKEGKVIIKLSPEVLEKAGLVKADISVFDSNLLKITSATFNLRIEKSVYNDTYFTDKDLDLMQQEYVRENERQKAENARAENELARITKEGQRNSNENTRISNEEARKKAEDTRVAEWNNVKKDATNIKNTLDTTIDTANTANNNLKNTIATGDKLKEDLTPQNYVKNSDYEAYKKEANSQYEDLANSYKHLGINLLPDSTFETGLVKENLKNARKQGLTIVAIGKPLYGKALNGHYCLTLCNFKTTSMEEDCYIYLGTAAKVEEGKKYAISFYYSSESDYGIKSSIYFKDNLRNHHQFMSNGIIAGREWKRCVNTWACPKGVNTLEPRFGFIAKDNAWLQITCIKVEEITDNIGVVTDWTPALEDYNYLVDVQSKRLDSIEKILIEKGFMTAQQTLNK